jgi:hypothetical protein
MIFWAADKKITSTMWLKDLMMLICIGKKLSKQLKTGKLQPMMVKVMDFLIKNVSLQTILIHTRW